MNMTNRKTTDRAERLGRMVRGLRARDGAALRQFYDEFSDAIRAIAMRYVRDEHDAEEVLHDVAWTVYRKIDRFAGASDFWRWVHVITRNASLMHLRRAKRNPTPYEDRDLHALRPDPSLLPLPPTGESRIDTQRAVDQLDDALSEGTELNRELFRRLVLDGETIADVAESSGLSVSATKSRLHRVRNDLRKVAARTLA